MCVCVFVPTAYILLCVCVCVPFYRQTMEHNCVVGRIIFCMNIIHFFRTRAVHIARNNEMVNLENLRRKLDAWEAHTYAHNHHRHWMMKRPMMVQWRWTTVYDKRMPNGHAKYSYINISTLNNSNTVIMVKWFTDRSRLYLVCASVIDNGIICFRKHARIHLNRNSSQLIATHCAFNDFKWKFHFYDKYIEFFSSSCLHFCWLLALRIVCGLRMSPSAHSSLCCVCVRLLTDVMAHRYSVTMRPKIVGWWRTGFYRVVMRRCVTGFLHVIANFNARSTSHLRACSKLKCIRSKHAINKSHDNHRCAVASVSFRQTNAIRLIYIWMVVVHTSACQL